MAAEKARVLGFLCPVMRSQAGIAEAGQDS